jgi:hypothetical protein
MILLLEFTNDEASCTTIPSLDIALAPLALSSSSSSSSPNDNNNSGNNNTSPLKVTPPLTCKKDVGGKYIRDPGIGKVIRAASSYIFVS